MSIKAKQSLRGSNNVGDVLKGDPGAPGKSAYDYAREAGYTGTEEEFAEKLASDKAGASSWNVLTDRPFYEETTTVGGDTLTWDGNTEGLLAVESYYKVSDVVPVLEDFSNGIKLGLHERNLGEQSITMTYEEIRNSADNAPGFIPLNSVGVVVLVDNATTTSGNSTVVFPEAGIYLRSTSGGSYATFITINGYDGFPVIKETIVKTIDHKYLPEALQFGEVNTFDPLVYDSTKEYETIEVSAMGGMVPFYKIAEYMPVTTDDASTLYIAAIDPTTGADVELDVGVDNVGGIQTVEHGWTIGDAFMIGSDGQCAILGDPLPSGIWVPDLSSMDIGMIFSEMILRPKTIVKTIDPKYLPENTSGGGTASAIPDDEMLEFLAEMDIVQPLSNTNNSVFTDTNDKLYVL